MDGSKIGGIIVSLLIAGGILWWKFGSKGDQSADVRDQMAAQLETLPDYSTYEGLYVELLDLHHEDAFEAHYSMGGRRSSADFDADAYLDALFESMAKDAHDRGYEAQAESLRELRRGLRFEPG